MGENFPVKRAAEIFSRVPILGTVRGERALRKDPPTLSFRGELTDVSRTEMLHCGQKGVALSYSHPQIEQQPSLQSQLTRGGGPTSSSYRIVPGYSSAMRRLRLTRVMVARTGELATPSIYSHCHIRRAALWLMGWWTHRKLNTSTILPSPTHEAAHSVLLCTVVCVAVSDSLRNTGYEGDGHAHHGDDHRLAEQVTHPSALALCR